MFKVTRIAEDRLDIQLEGRLEKDSMEAALDDFANESEGIKNGKMLYIINDFQFPSLEAIGVELSRLPSLFRLINQFDKAAVITDKTWIKHASELEGLLIPGLQIKAFTSSERNSAEQWLSE